VRQNIDGHWYKRRYENAVRNLKADRKISDHNREAVFKFLRDLESQNVGIPRQTKYLFTLPVIAKKLGINFEKARIDDIKRVVAEINQSTKYSDWTKSDFRVALKRFYRWLHDSPKGETPKEVAWIVTGNSKKTLLPEELLAENDVSKLAAAAENSRDRAFVLTLYESDARIGELLNLRRKHAVFDQFGAVLLVAGKSGHRRIRTVLSAPALAEWMNDHPDKGNPEAPLWTVVGDRNHGQPLMYESARQLLRRLAERADLKKKVNPHIFRHSRSTILANHLTEAQLKEFAGWTQSSKMPGRYVHLSGRNVDDALLRMHGLKNDEEKQPLLTAKLCPRCHQQNDPLASFCPKCGLALKLEAAMEVEAARNEAETWLSKLLEDPEVRALFLAKLKPLLASEARGNSQPTEAERPLEQPAS
jgi:integrase/recombinase XerD